MMFPKRSYPFSWDIGWSFSRMNLFRQCQRQYWYSYYAKRMIGKTSLLDEDVGDLKLAVGLKDISNVYFMVGNAVHDTIAKVINSAIKHESTTFTVESSIFPVDSAVRSAIQHYTKAYEWPLTGNDIHRESIEKSIRNFYTRWVPTILESSPEDRKAWVVDPPGYGEFRFDNKKAYAKPDFMLKIGDEWYIIDWKTGKPYREDNKTQLMAYMFFAIDIYGAYGINKDNVTGVVEYLSQDNEDPLTVMGTDIDTTELSTLITQDMEDMNAMLTRPRDNWPKPVSAFTKNPTKFNCEFCNYSGLCKPELEVD